MMKIIKSLILFIFIFTNSGLSKASIRLSKECKISLITFSTGEELNALFGHSGIRISDKKNNIDVIFNYGTFDFRVDNFYLKFARGKLMYMLAAKNFSYTKRNYIYENRGIIEQKLNLDSISKQRLFDALVENLKPKNKYYHYDFLYDNCSTRIRDIIIKTTSKEISFAETPKVTFWNLLDVFLVKNKWIQLGIHVILGNDCIKEIDNYEQMFLPDYLMYAFENATYKDSGESFVSETQTIFSARQTNSKDSIFHKSTWVLAIISLMLLVLSFAFHKRKISFKIFDFVLFFTLGIIGCIIVFLWFFTDHQATGSNFNIMWSMPLNIIFAFALLKTKISRITQIWFLLNFIILILTIILIAVVPSYFAIGITPILILACIRTYFIQRRFKIRNK